MRDTNRALVIQSVCEIESDLCEKIADFFIGRNKGVTREAVMEDLYYESGLLGSLARIAKIAFISPRMTHTSKTATESMITLLTGGLLDNE